MKFFTSPHVVSIWQKPGIQINTQHETKFCVKQFCFRVNSAETILLFLYSREMTRTHETLFSKNTIKQVASVRCREKVICFSFSSIPQTIIFYLSLRRGNNYMEVILFCWFCGENVWSHQLLSNSMLAIKGNNLTTMHYSNSSFTHYEKYLLHITKRKNINILVT